MKRTGENNSNWKGGKTIMADGRTLIYDPDNPRARAIGGLYILEYRLIAEQKVGRPLTENEIVHHINGDVTDNHPDNLEVMTQAEHIRLHSDICGQRSKLTQEMANKIRLDTRLQKDIAKDYGISRGYVSRVKNIGIRRPANELYL